MAKWIWPVWIEMPDDYDFDGAIDDEKREIVAFDVVARSELGRAMILATQRNPYAPNTTIHVGSVIFPSRVYGWDTSYDRMGEEVRFRLDEREKEETVSDKNWVEQEAEKNEMKIGADVHYVTRGSADGFFPTVCRAAKIAEVQENGLPRIVVFNPQGIFFDDVAYASTNHQPGTFHFPDECEEYKGVVT